MTSKKLQQQARKAKDPEQIEQEKLMELVKYDLKNFQKIHSKEYKSPVEMAVAFCERWPGYKRNPGARFVEKLLKFS